MAIHLRRQNRDRTDVPAPDDGDDGLLIDLVGLADPVIEISDPGTGPAHPDRGGPAPDGLGSPSAADAARYSAWAERMRAKRRSDQHDILGTDAIRLDGNWGPDSVLGSGARTSPLDGGLTAPDHFDLGQAHDVLGLAPDATSDDATAAYRALAKVHHPDCWAEAPDAEQQDHAEAMLRINAAYQAVRSTSI